MTIISELVGAWSTQNNRTYNLYLENKLKHIVLPVEAMKNICVMSHIVP